MLQLPLAADIFQRAPLLLRLLRLIQQSKDPGSAGQGVLQLRHHGADVVEGLHILAGTESPPTERLPPGISKTPASATPA